LQNIGQITRENDGRYIPMVGGIRGSLGKNEKKKEKINLSL